MELFALARIASVVLAVVGAAGMVALALVGQPILAIVFAFATAVALVGVPLSRRPRVESAAVEH